MRRFVRHLSTTIHPHEPLPFPLHPSPQTFSKTWSNPSLRTPTKFPSTFLPPLIPAFKSWFLPNSPNELNIPYLNSLSSPSSSLQTTVPVEITLPSGDVEVSSFEFDDFLSYLSSPDLDPEIPKLYLTQHPPPLHLLHDLPPPFPHLGFKTRPPFRKTTTTAPPKAQEVEKERKEEEEKENPEIDIYSTSLWLSRIPHSIQTQTHTPLHRDPTDNIFLQLASSKIITTIPPLLGDKIFSHLHRHSKLSSTDPRGRIRDGLLEWKESSVLDRVVWYDENGKKDGEGGELEAEDEIERGVINLLKSSGEVYKTVVRKGEAVYIPAGWWHSVKSVLPDHTEELEGKGVVASMNWWFR
ncbi:hypothetical protein TWF718_008603 [Orbilia javanica]|uniref:JmjC domain-containing protein n=1 Tax=Orbilia javanica TaxID=47235 RepID=A0AAN8MND0_9PEZI